MALTMMVIKWRDQVWHSTMTWQVIFTSCRYLNHCSGPLEAEFRACVEGLELALLHCQLPTIVDTDCAQMLAAAKEKLHDRSSLVHLVSELRTLIDYERVFDLVKVERAQVKVSHNLANFAGVNRISFLWLGLGPDVVNQFRKTVL
jgi:hypothetical protein